MTYLRYTHVTYLRYTHVTYLRYTHVEIETLLRCCNNCTLVRLWYLTEYSVKIRVLFANRIYCKNYQLGRKENNKTSPRTNESTPFLLRIALHNTIGNHAYGFQLVFLTIW